MTKVLPSLAMEFGLMPWHLGGDEYLTYDEWKSFTDTLHDLSQARKQSHDGLNRSGRRRSPRHR